MSRRCWMASGTADVPNAGMDGSAMLSTRMALTPIGYGYHAPHQSVGAKE